MQPQDLNIADARIDASSVDQKAGRVSIDIYYHEHPDAKETKKATLVFEGARSLDRVAESLKMAKKPGGSTLLHWQPSAPGNTFLYLRDGVISIWAQQLHIDKHYP